MIWHTRHQAAAPTTQRSSTSAIAKDLHPDEDDLERYAMGVVRDESELAGLEEHLLACPFCVARTEALEVYVWSIRPPLRQCLIEVVGSRR